MKHARDVMSQPLVIEPDVGIEDLVSLLLDHPHEGACVVEDGKIVGVVTEMDLIFREKNVHMPTVITILEFVLPLGMKQTRDEIDKISAATVRELMTENPITAAPDTPLSDIATLMVEKHVSMVPVLEDGLLVGVITKSDLLRAVGAQGRAR